MITLKYKESKAMIDLSKTKHLISTIFTINY